MPSSNKKKRQSNKTEVVVASRNNKNDGDDEENPNTAQSRRGSSSPRRQRKNLSMDWIQLCFLGQIICAFVLILEFTKRNNKYKNNGFWGYGLAVSIVAICFSLLGMLLYSAIYDGGYGRSLHSSMTCGQLITKFLVLWWFIAAIILTFGNGPFVTTGNGYFATWGGLLFAVGCLGTGLSATFGMMICSIVLIIAIIPYVGNKNGIALYALLVAAFTALVLLIYFFMTTPLNSNANVALGVFALLAIFWLVLPFLTTFPGGPFRATGNGYFASWIGALVSVSVASGAYNSVE